MIEVTILTRGALHTIPVSSLQIAMELATANPVRAYVARVWLRSTVGGPILFATVRRGDPMPADGGPSVAVLFAPVRSIPPLVVRQAIHGG